jgi:ElaB/YqjD/DUF883 family membrane-anchored ribosome-binding protein
VPDGIQAGFPPIYFPVVLNEVRGEFNVMEVYFKELISKDNCLEKLVEDLERVVQGADELAKSIGVNVAESPEHPVALRLLTLKERCEGMKQRILQRAGDTDRFVRKNPYPFLFMAGLLGMVVGVRLAMPQRIVLAEAIS